MPYPQWAHTCPKAGGTTSHHAPFTCKTCRERAVFSGWLQPMHASMASYQHRHGLKPVGPHRKLADEAYTGVWARCEGCGGSGLQPIETGVFACAACDGVGATLLVPVAELQRRREQVLTAYPDAGAPLMPFESVLGRAHVHDVGSGKMLSVQHAPAPSVRGQSQGAPLVMPAMDTAESLHLFGIAALLVPLGLGGGVALLREGRIIDGLFLLHIGASMAWIALVGAGAVTLRLRTVRVVLLVLLAVLVLLFLLAMVNGVASSPG